VPGRFRAIPVPATCAQSHGVVNIPQDHAPGVSFFAWFHHWPFVSQTSTVRIVLEGEDLRRRTGGTIIETIRITGCTVRRIGNVTFSVRWM
jgi:hypothetical protein